MKKRYKLMLWGLSLLLLTSCEIVSPTEYESVPMPRPDKELTAREIVAGKYKAVSVWNSGTGTKVDNAIFATFDSLLNMYPEYAAIFADMSKQRTFIVPTNQAFDAFYKDNGQRVNNTGSGARLYFKLAQIPDSTRRAIVLTHILDQRLHTDQMTERANYQTLYKSANKPNNAFAIISLDRTEFGVGRVNGEYRFHNNANRGVYGYSSDFRSSNLEPKNGVLHAVDNFVIRDRRDFWIGSIWRPL